MFPGRNNTYRALDMLTRTTTGLPGLLRGVVPSQCYTRELMVPDSAHSLAQTKRQWWNELRHILVHDRTLKCEECLAIGRQMIVIGGLLRLAYS
jgi:hypothetical protein